MKKEKISIFLSHSHKDQDKVRKIRDILESLECEPLIFFLKCLDDENEQLEEFIKKEIEARSLFLYCKSKNAENSEWVKKELDYIRSFDEKRLYTIDIEKDFSFSLISFLQMLAKILKRNRIFISYSHQDEETVNALTSCLQKNGYDVINTMLNQTLFSGSWVDQIREAIDRTVEEGVYIFICSKNSIQSKFCMEELRYAMCIKKNDSIVLPIIIDDGDQHDFPREIRHFMALIVHRKPTEDDLKNLVRHLNHMTKKI